MTGYVTDQAQRMVWAFTADPAEQAKIRAFLRNPIDGHGLSDQDWAIGERYVKWLATKGVPAFTEKGFNALLYCVASEDASLPED